MSIKFNSVKGLYNKSKNIAKDAKDVYQSAKQKIQPKIDEIIADVQYAMNPSKLEVLGKEKAEAQKKFLNKTALLALKKSSNYNEGLGLSILEKEVQKAELAAQQAVLKYNEFAAKQAACQKAFETINK